LGLRRQIAIARTWLPLFLSVTLLASAAALVFSGLQQKLYQAQATLIVGQSLSAINPDYNQLLVSQRLSSTYASVATTRPNLEAVIKQLHLDEGVDQLAGQVSASAALDSTLLTITVQDTDPTRAADIANALADQLVATSPAVEGRQTDLQQTIDAELAATQNQITTTRQQIDALTGLPFRTAQQDVDLQTLDNQLVALRSTYATLLSYSSANGSNLLSIVEPAVPNTVPVSPRTLLNVLLAAVLAFLLVAGLVVARERLDTRVREADELEATTGLGVLGAISQIRTKRGQPLPSPMAMMHHPHSAIAESYRSLRTNIDFATAEAPIRSLLVASPLAGEGRTTMATNLAVAFAQLDRKVILIDADLRRPMVHIIFDTPNSHGLTTLLRSPEMDPTAVMYQTHLDNLRVITSGPLPPNPSELLGSRMSTLVEKLKADADLIIIDSAASQAVADALILSSFVDATLVVVDVGHTPRGVVRQVQDDLSRAGGRVIGAVVNGEPAYPRADLARYGFEVEGLHRRLFEPRRDESKRKARRGEKTRELTLEAEESPTPSGQ
jgi:succinoglycan biosynthesis transport protein ExoP